MTRIAVSRFVPATVAASLLAILLAWGGDASAQIAPSEDPACLSTGMDLVFTGSQNVTRAVTGSALEDPAACLTTGMDLVFVLGDAPTAGQQPQVPGLVSGVSYLSTGMDLWLAPLGVIADF